VVWKTPLPGESWSSPIVWDERVFVTTATDNGQTCRVLCLDTKNGQILWNRDVFQQLPRRKEGRNTYATPTPATEGQRVYACFGDGSFVALHFAGEIVWTNRAVLSSRSLAQSAAATISATWYPAPKIVCTTDTVGPGAADVPSST